MWMIYSMNWFVWFFNLTSLVRLGVHTPSRHPDTRASDNRDLHCQGVNWQYEFPATGSVPVAKFC